MKKGRPGNQGLSKTRILINKIIKIKNQIKEKKTRLECENGFPLDWTRSRGFLSNTRIRGPKKNIKPKNKLCWMEDLATVLS